MSSSDKFPDWSVFKEREVPPTFGAEELLSPALAVSAALQRSSIELAETRKRVHHEHDASGEALAQQAVYVFRMASLLDRCAPNLTKTSLRQFYHPLRIVKDQMLEALRDVGIEIEDPHGKSFEEVDGRVDMQWRQDQDFSTEIVAEVQEPIVMYHGNLVRKGRVIMGGPPLEDPDTSDLDK